MMPGGSRRSDLSRPQQNPTKLDLTERALSYVRSSVLEEILVNGERGGGDHRLGEPGKRITENAEANAGRL